MGGLKDLADVRKALTVPPPLSVFVRMGPPPPPLCGYPLWTAPQPTFLAKASK